MAPARADTGIDTLEARGLVAVAAHRPELEYLFRHWLVQDAAYTSLLKQERRTLHHLVGETLETLYPERRGELAGVLAMHFEQAGDAARAVEYLVMDGRSALDRAALQEAFAAFDRAANLLAGTVPSADATGDSDRARLDVAILRARAGLTFRDPDDVAGDLEAVVPLAERLGDLELLAQVHLHLALALVEGRGSADDPRVLVSLERLKEIGEALDDPSLAALPEALMGMGKVFTGPVQEGVDALEQAIPAMERRSDFIGAAFARGWLAMGYATLGDFPNAEQAAREAVAEAAGGDRIAQLDADLAMAMVRSQQGRLDEAGPLALECTERAQETGAVLCGMVSSWLLGDVYQRQRRFVDARDALRLGLALSPAAHSGLWPTNLRAWLRATEEIAEGSPGAADDWEGALAEARRGHDRLGEAGIRWKRAEGAAARADVEAALADFEASAALYETQGARPSLARVTRAWGEALARAGRMEEGRERLRTALALFEAMGLPREAGEVRDALSGAAGAP